MIVKNFISTVKDGGSEEEGEVGNSFFSESSDPEMKICVYIKKPKNVEFGRDGLSSTGKETIRLSTPRNNHTDRGKEITPQK